MSIHIKLDTHQSDQSVWRGDSEDERSQSAAECPAFMSKNNQNSTHCNVTHTELSLLD